MANHRGVKLAATFSLVGALAFGGLLPSYSQPIQDATDSPALARTIENPTISSSGAVVPPQPRAGFRVLPYLQKPAANQMTLNWFTESGSPAKLIVTGPGLPAAGKQYTVTGDRNSINAYQEAELKLGGATQPSDRNYPVTSPLSIPKGSYIRADNPFKYSQTIQGLNPDSAYQYQVSVDGYTHKASFKTMPATGAALTKPLKIIAYADTETDPVGRVTYREWQPTTKLAPGSEDRPALDSAWAKKFGTRNQGGEMTLRYALTEDMAQYYNNKMIAEQNPDMVLLAGDIVERGSSQTHWDEFWDYFAGVKGTLLSSVPIITSLGNHEVYGYCSGTISSGEHAGKKDCPLVVRARMEYNRYFDTFGSDNPDAMNAYHRVDQGKVTYISLDVTNGEPDMTPASVTEEQKSVGNDANLTKEQYGTDTQNSFTKEEYDIAFNKYAVANGWAKPGAKPDQPNFMPGSDQYKWLEAQLKDARAKGQMIIVQYHHTAYSSGVHGTTMGNNHPDSQPGTPVRHLQPLFEKYDVGIVISGHDELFEASYVDEDKDGKGTYHWDVGVASDGLRADKRIKLPDGTYGPYDFNTNLVWMSQSHEPEMWKTNANGVKHLVSGGKHYGHLEMMVEPFSPEVVPAGSANAPADGVIPAYSVTMTPIAAFPVLDDSYNVKEIERREMTGGIFTVYYTADGQVIDPSKVILQVDAPTEVGLIQAQLNKTEVTQGEDVTVSVSGLQADEELLAAVHSVVIDLGAKTASPAGSMSWTFSTANLAPGAHKVVLTNGSGQTKELAFTVLEKKVPGQGKKVKKLPKTGV